MYSLHHWALIFCCVFRSTKPRNRPSFRQIQMHLEIATPEWLNISIDEFAQLQVGAFCFLIVLFYSQV